MIWGQGWKGKNYFFQFLNFYQLFGLVPHIGLLVSRGRSHSHIGAGGISGINFSFSPSLQHLDHNNSVLLIPSSCLRIQDRSPHWELSPKGWFCPSSHMVELSWAGLSKASENYSLDCESLWYQVVKMETAAGILAAVSKDALKGKWAPQKGDTSESVREKQGPLLLPSPSPEACPVSGLCSGLRLYIILS